MVGEMGCGEVTFLLREICSSLAVQKGTFGSQSLFSFPFSPSHSFQPEDNRMGTRLGLQCPAGIRSTKWVSDDGLELGRRMLCHQSRSVTGCAVSTVKKATLSVVSLPSLSPPRANLGNSRVGRGRVSSRPHPQWAARSRAPHSPPRPRPETLEAAPPPKLWMQEWETLIITTPLPSPPQKPR